MGSLDEASAQFARRQPDPPGTRLGPDPSPPGEQPRGADSQREFWVMAGLACSAVAAIKLPEVFGIESFDDPGSFYFRNVTLLVMPMMAGYFAWKRKLKWKHLRLLTLSFATVAVFANAYPFDHGIALSGTDLSDTEALTALHLPILTWLLVGVAHTGGDWRDHAKRMDYVRFTGEWILYYGLIAVAGQIFTGVVLILFFTIEVDISTLFEPWILGSAAAGAAVVAAWLAETRRGVLERVAPVLTSLMSPLLAIALAAFLGAAAITGRGLDMDREVLIFFDLLLALIVGLVVYSIAVRDPQKPPGIFDLVQLALITASLLADALMLTAILGRLSDFGFTPNRVAALGENLVLLVNLAWSARLYFGFWRGHRPFAAVERWQTGYAVAYAGWAGVVVVAFPPVFGFA